jgi:hypothetical protein
VNWLGLSARSLVGIVLGVALGIALFLCGYPSVVLVGACTGVGCALFAEDRSALRGISVATVATWAAAVVDARRLGVSTLSISSTLTLGRWLAYLGCIAAAFLIGGSTIRRTAKTRTAGT